MPHTTGDPGDGRAPEHFYLHIPFCARRCFYCDFAVQPGRRPPEAEWVEAIGAELRRLPAARGWSGTPTFDTLYVGGGTPSMISPAAYAATVEALRKIARWDPDRIEWTSEANPETFTADLARDWRGQGVGRVSIGVQSFHPPTLRWMGRLHGPRGAVEAVRHARQAGYRSVNVDLIFGVPARLGRPWREDVEAILALEPDHVSLYGLTAEPGAPLGRRVEAGTEALAGEERYTEEYLEAHDRLVAEGFDHYEVSNFALPGHRSRHNEAYWRGRAYGAAGPGAHSYEPPVRRWNEPDWDAYRTRLARGGLPVVGEEVVDGEAARLERLWLGLRTDRGIDPADAGDGALVDRWVTAGWALREDDRIRLTPAGWIRMDALVVELAAATERPR